LCPRWRLIKTKRHHDLRPKIAKIFVKKTKLYEFAMQRAQRRRGPQGAVGTAVCGDSALERIKNLVGGSWCRYHRERLEITLIRGARDFDAPGGMSTMPLRRGSLPILLNRQILQKAQDRPIPSPIGE